MSDPRSPNDAGNAQTGGGPRTMSEDEVVRLWERFKSGGIAPCPRDHAPLALAVDGAAKSYRLVCTRCGNASLWFEIAPGGVNVRGADDGPEPAHSDD